MNPRAIVLAVAAVLVIGVTVFMMKAFLGKKPETVVQKEKLVLTQILVAKQRLSAGEFVDTTNVTWAPWPNKNVPPAYLQNTTTKIPDLLGSVVRNSVAAGDPITSGRLVRPGDRGFVAAVLRPGYRAVSIAINAQTGVSGLIYPGDHVDIILTKKVGAGKLARNVSETVLQDIRIVAIDQSLGAAPASGAPAAAPKRKAKIGRTVTLEVTPKLAESLVLGQKMGTLTLVLRSLAKGKLPALTKEQNLDYGEPSRGNSYTSENDVSRIGKGSASSVQVVRGTKAKNKTIKSN